jgi:rSAM/selenodomain-associated transferase 2
MSAQGLEREVSFVIPVLNEQAAIRTLLRDLRSRFPQSPLIVVDGGSSDNTVALAMPLCDQLLLGEAGRAAQMNLGGRVAVTEYVAFLHADSSPGIDARDFMVYVRDLPPWGFCRIRLSGERRIFRVIEWFMNQRSRLTRVATGDQMLFLRRELFMSSGGFDEIPLMEDVAYSKRLRREGAPLVIPEPVTTSSRRWEEQGVLRTMVRMWLLRLAYFCGVSPRSLWRYYYGG